jgi:hypothetical protein
MGLFDALKKTIASQVKVDVAQGEKIAQEQLKAEEAKVVKQVASQVAKNIK